VLRSSELGIGYPGTVLFTAEPIELRRKECAALIGPNGSGKTTFLNTILEKIEPLAGQLRLGSSLKIGHFAQAHDKLNMEGMRVTIWQNIFSARMKSTSLFTH